MISLEPFRCEKCGQIIPGWAREQHAKECPAPPPKKKPYTKPKLTVYGDIRGMTESSLARSRRSDHSKGRLKTA